ncbi:MAG: hypothetical protein Q9168_004445 [Polycauliona sp. 1 TL-2023]
MALLHELDPSVSMDQGLDSIGGLKYRANIFINNKATSENTPLEDRQLVALALTEACCKIGSGKVFWVALPQKPDLSELHWDASNQLAYEATFAYEQAPKLVYQLYNWGDIDKSYWLGLKHSDRLAFLQLFGADINLTGIPLLPIELSYDALERTVTVFNGLNDEETGPKATLIIAPKAYLGWSRQLKQGAELVVEDYTTTLWNCDLQHLETYRRKTSIDVVNGLFEMMVRENEPRAVCFLKDIVEYMRELHVKMTKLGSKVEWKV